MTTAPGRPRGYIPTLDGWRAIAVLLVIGAHSSRMLRASGSEVAVRLAQFFEHAGYGVDIFFAISGFLISSLLLREKHRGTISLKNFYIRRFFRIIPPIIPYLLLIGVLGLCSILPISGAEIISVLFFYRNYADGSWYTGHFWSLGVEEHFYLLVPLALALCQRRAALQLALFAAGLCVIIRYLEAKYFGGKVEFHTESRFDALMYGCVLAIVLTYGNGKDFLQRHLTAVSVGIIIVLAMVLCIIEPAMPFRRAVIAALIPVVLGYSVLKPTTVLGKFLELDWLRWVGRLSYSLYIWQMLFFVPVVHFRAIQSMPMALIGTLACAMLSYRFIEQPAMRWGKRFHGSQDVATSQSRSFAS